jgi:hypothetical protein
LVGFVDEAWADAEEGADAGVLLDECGDGFVPVFEAAVGGEDGAEVSDVVVADFVGEFCGDGFDGVEDAVAEGDAVGVGGGPPVRGGVFEAGIGLVLSFRC